MYTVLRVFICITVLFPLMASAQHISTLLSGVEFRVPTTLHQDPVFEKKFSLIRDTMYFSPLGFAFPNILVEFDPHLREPRGRLRGKQMTLSTLVESPEEFLKLFVHELGHCIDIYILRADPKNQV